MTALTKDERWEIYRLCKRARGLYKAEKQALVFIGEAQTMQEGVCRKALRNVEDFGNGVRQVQRGIHGHRRNGKLEFPGLLTRRIVSASGYLKGGRAPGGKGLATTYTINLDMLMTFIPEIDDDPPPKKMGITLGDTKSVTSSEKGVTLGDRVRTSSCSSSLGSSPSDESSCSKFRTAGERILGNSTRSERLNAENLVVVGGAPENQNRGQKESEPVSQEDRAERIIAASRARQLDRNQTDAEIYRDYKAVFDRLEREYQAWMNEPSKSGVAICGAHFDNPLQSTAKHRHAAADLYRAIGRDAALAKWENFLVHEDHNTTTGKEIFDDDSGAPTGRFYSEDVERTWLLHDFVLNHGVPKVAAGTPELSPSTWTRNPTRRMTTRNMPRPPLVLL